MTLYRTTVSAGEGLNFVISDATRDRHGTRINPNGWELSEFNKNRIALFSHDTRLPIGRWHDVHVENDKLVGRLELAKEGTGPRVDEIVKLVEQGFLRAVSAGFEVIDHGKPGQSEFDYERQSLVEASIVAVGSNPNALMQARAMNLSDDTLSLVFGEQAARPAMALNGRHAATSPINGKPKMQTLSAQVETAQTNLNAARDALTAHLKDENADLEQTNLLSDGVQERVQKLEILQKAERSMAAQTQTIDLPSTVVSRRPLGVKHREAAPQENLIRAATAHFLAYCQRQPVDRILQDRYGDYHDRQEIEAITAMMSRAAMTPATTTTATWAAELAATATADFVSQLDPSYIFPRLAPMGRQLTFGPDRAHITFPSESATPSPGGSFIAEGGAIPVRKMGFTSITLSPSKVAVISVFTSEIMRMSNPQIEGIVRDRIRRDTAIMLDQLLLDATASSAARPAGLLFGVSATTASTNTNPYGAIMEDIIALATKFWDVNAGRKLVLIMHPANAMMMATAVGPDGTMGWVQEFTNRFTILESTNVTKNKVIMIDAADLVSVLAVPQFDVSDQATVHMEDTTPLPIATGAQGSGVLATPTSSLWQQDLVGLRMRLDATWAMIRTGMVQYINVVDWS
jgi:HK97 family phage prohead protease/HK97 family phage major capsid protein